MNRNSPFIAGFTRYFFSLLFVTVLVIASNTSLSYAQTTESQDKLERAQIKATKQVRQMANTVDNFFSMERHFWNDNPSRLTLQGNFDWIDNHGWELNPTIRTNWALPGLNDRLKLVVNEVHSSGSVGGAGADDDPTAALRWAGSSGKSKNNGYSLDLGLSGYGDPSVQVFGRINAYRRWGIGLWNLRLQNRLFYYATSELRNDFRTYVERPVTDQIFFRSRTRFDYSQEKDSQWYPSQTFTLFQEINDRTAIAWEAYANEVFPEDAVFDPDEFLRSCGKSCRTYHLRFRFRQNVGYRWLFYEVWPGVAWPEARDYEFTPGIRIRLEVVLGDPPDKIQFSEF